VAFQEKFKAATSYEPRSTGAKEVIQTLQPVAEFVTQASAATRRTLEPYIGDAGVTIAAVVAQSTLEIVGTVTGLRSLKGLVGDIDLTPSSATRSTTTSVAAEVSETVAAARVRQVNMLADNEAFNISPKSWDQYPTIGRNGTFVTDRAGVMKYFDDVPAGQTQVVISAERAATIEADMGLVAGTLEDGFKLRQVTGVRDMMPNSPTVGNEHFLGAGRHLPGGAPEMVINSIPTVDNAAVRTLMEVRVGAGTSARPTGGLRTSPALVLDQSQIHRLTQEFIEVGGDPSILRFNRGSQTAYLDKRDRINVRGDVLPIEGALHPRSSMSSRAVLAHELGHRQHRDVRDVPKLQPGAWNDEFRASYWAAKNAPSLTHTERVDLLNDAISRAREGGIPIRLNKFMKETLYGYN
jgi:hypothetical protein